MRRLFLCTVLSATQVSVPTAMGQAADAVTEIAPPDVPKRGGAQYFTTIPSQRVLTSVNVFGDVYQPGAHFVPVNATLLDVVAQAGGPTGTASIPYIELIRGGASSRVDLYADGIRMHVQAQDTIIIARSVKSELPLYFSAISTVVSVMTLYFVTRKK